MNRKERSEILKSCSFDDVIDLTADKLSSVPHNIKGTIIDLTGFDQVSPKIINEVPYAIDSDDEPMDSEPTCAPIATVSAGNSLLNSAVLTTLDEPMDLRVKVEKKHVEEISPVLTPIKIEVKAESIINEQEPMKVKVKEEEKSKELESNSGVQDFVKAIHLPLTPNKADDKTEIKTKKQELDSSILNLWKKFQSECLTADPSNEMKVLMSKLTKKFHKATVEYRKSKKFQSLIDGVRKKVKKFPRLAAFSLSEVSAGLTHHQQEKTQQESKANALKDETTEKEKELKEKIPEEKLNANVLNDTDIVMTMTKEAEDQAPEAMTTEQRKAELARLKAECVRIADECADDSADDVDRLGDVSFDYVITNALKFSIDIF